MEAPVLGQQGLARHLHQLGGHLDAGHAPADHDEREQAAALVARLGLLGHLEQLDHAGAQRHGVDDGLERPGVLDRPGDVVVVGLASHRHHQHLEALDQVVVEPHLAPRQVDGHDLVLLEADVAVLGHGAQRVDDVPRLDRAHRHGGQQGIELEEVLFVDQQRVPVLAGGAGTTHRAGDVEPAESAAEDEEPPARHGRAV